jgi:hypothetical protein
LSVGQSGDRGDLHTIAEDAVLVTPTLSVDAVHEPPSIETDAASFVGAGGWVDRERRGPA